MSEQTRAKAIQERKKTQPDYGASLKQAVLIDENTQRVAIGLAPSAKNASHLEFWPDRPADAETLIKRAKTLIGPEGSFPIRVIQVGKSEPSKPLPDNKVQYFDLYLEQA